MVKDDKKLEAISIAKTNESEPIKVYDEDLSKVVFEADINEKKNRGRPAGTVKTERLIGAPSLKKKPYSKKKQIEKAILLIKMIADPKIIPNILERSYKLSVEDISSIDKNTLSDTFVDDQVDITILSYFEYIDENCFKKLKKIVKLKVEKFTTKKKGKSSYIFTCNICSKEADDETVFCESCLMWFHIKCAHYVKTKGDWFCSKCS